MIQLYSLTKNEARVIDFLIRNFKEKNSINGLGRRLGLSPRGIYKILKKLENMNVIKSEKIGNAIYYKVNLDDEVGAKLAEFVLVQNELNSYAKVQADDLKSLKEITQSCVLFGSVLKKGKESNDIDILLILEKDDFKKVHKSLSGIKELKPKKIHDVMMTKEDLINNLKKGDEVIADIMKTGKVLWGPETIVEAIKYGSS